MCTLNEKDLDFSELEAFQICNHFEGIDALVTKRGFADLLKEAQWVGKDSQELSPRCYNLGESWHRADFIDDFRMTAAVNIVKYLVLTYELNQTQTQGVGGLRIEKQLLQNVITACVWFVRVKLHG